jgi:uncharacterized protein (TIGR04222 family)
MNWLFENPISELPGPLFLGLYAGVIVLVIVEGFWRRYRADRSLDLGPEPIPSKLDPVEIAYLRGGENEVTRLLVFDLIRRGYLRVEETSKKFAKGTESKIGQVPEHPDLDPLLPIEVDAFEFFREPQKPEALFKPGGLASRLKAGTWPMAESLREQGLISSPEQVSAAWRNWFAGALMILAFGGFKFVVALLKGKHNVTFLLILGAIGLVVLGITCAVPRLTRRGRDYLARLREAFEGLKPRLAEAHEHSPYDPAFVLVPAIFGVSALVGTPFSYAPDLFKSAAASSSGGCGGSSCGGGGGGCGGGGCGGGCGGCGG